MASFGVNQADQYGGQGGGGYFSLKNDGDVAKVRFLYNGIEDVIGYSVHEVEVNGKKRYANCLRNYGDAMDACPLCASGSPVRVKYFIPLYKIDDDSIVTWERGKNFGQKLTSLCARYPNLVSHRFEIERHGQAGSKDTIYEIYEVGKDDDVTIEDFEVEDPMGGIILDKSAGELDAFVRTGRFPDVNDGGNNNQFQRRTSTESRRTPNGGEGRRPVF